MPQLRIARLAQVCIVLLAVQDAAAYQFEFNGSGGKECVTQSPSYSVHTVAKSGLSSLTSYSNVYCL